MSKPAAFGKTLRYLGEAAPFFLFMGFCKLIGIDAASAVGGFIGRHVFYRLGPANTARHNLKAAYPEKTRAEIEEIVRAVCDNLGRVAGEYPHLDKLISGPGGRVEAVGMENGDDAVASGKGVMFVSGHFANWEVMVNVATQHGYEGALVYRPPNNPYVDRFISRQRAKQGPKEHISKGAQGTRRIFTLLRRGKSIFMLVDQKTYEGVPAPYFGREVMTTPAPASLALKLGALLMPATVERLNGAHFRMRVYPPIAFEPRGDAERDVLELTAKINATIEELVRRNPSQWLWTHHRWTSARDLERMKQLNHAAGGKGVRVEREGSSLT
jgi:Kdo2-lipid IVA lauroyltransferase/acyltransferase